MNIMPLAPKMTLQYAERARNGDWQYHLGSGIYCWFVGNQKVTIIDLNNPTGNIQKMTAREIEAEKTSLKVYANKEHLS